MTGQERQAQLKASSNVCTYLGFKVLLAATRLTLPEDKDEKNLFLEGFAET